MRITQAYISPSVADFPFLSRLNLTEYVDSEAPCLFIGCYTFHDFVTIKSHRGKAVVLWCGQDSLDCIFYGWHNELKNRKHITYHDNIERALKAFLPIEQIPVFNIGGDFKPSKFGKKVFVYCPDSHPMYHRIDIVNQLIEDLPDFQFIIGRGVTPQNVWLDGYGDSIYDECFIGLVLSGYAGGGQTIVQMGMKGRFVVTNALNTYFPNIINWNSIDDIKKIIIRESNFIGTDRPSMANMVNLYINKELNWLEI